jgi:hypothetical protein
LLLGCGSVVHTWPTMLEALVLITRTAGVGCVTLFNGIIRHFGS